MALPDQLNPTLRDLPVYHPGRPLEEVARDIGSPPDQLIKLASNENPLGPSQFAVQAMRDAAGEMHRYPDGNAFYLRKELADKLEIEPNQLVFGNGSNEIIEFIAHALLGPGDEIVVSEYCFAIYPIVAKMMRAKVNTVPALGLGHDLPGMLAKITPQTKAVFVANPNNPTGTIASRAEVEQLIDGMPTDVLLVMDEAYIEYQEDSIDLLPRIRSGNHPNLILMRTFSKIYGLAGLRVGYGMGHPEFIAALEKVRQPFNLNAMAQAAAIAALEDEQHIQLSREQNRKGSIYFENALENSHIDYQHSHANFLLVNVGDGAAVSAEMEKLGVIVRPLGGYGLSEWVRLTIGTDLENQRCHQSLCQVLGHSEN